jgi:hypothetical protein
MGFLNGALEKRGSFTIWSVIPYEFCDYLIMSLCLKYLQNQNVSSLKPGNRILPTRYWSETLYQWWGATFMASGEARFIVHTLTKYFKILTFQILTYGL